MYIRSTRQSGALNILNAWLDPESTTLSLIFEVCRGAEYLGSLSLPASEFGLSDFDTMPAFGRWFQPGPKTLISWLQALLPKDETPVWLSFGTHPDPAGAESTSPRIGRTQSRPSGYLAVLSWELNLVPALGRPVLRMQGLPIRPLTQHRTLHLAICCSFSAAKQTEPPHDTLKRIFDQIPQFPQQSVTLHLFADLELQPFFATLQASLQSRSQVRIYPPTDAAKYGDAERISSVPDTSDLQNPWLLWMRDSLAEVGVDAVQFVTHGYAARGHGALAFAESPMHNEDRRWARFVGTREISMLMDQLGAWSVLLTSSPDNYSVAGLRILHDELTEFISGPVMLYEMRDDPAQSDLRSAYEYVFGADATQPPAAGAISLYTHPDWKQPPDSDEEIPTQRWLGEFTLSGPLHDAFASANEVPAWLAAGQRTLERSVAKMTLAAEETESGRAEQAGRQEALQFTAELFARFARSEGISITPAGLTDAKEIV